MNNPAIIKKPVLNFNFLASQLVVNIFGYSSFVKLKFKCFLVASTFKKNYLTRKTFISYETISDQLFFLYPLFQKLAYVVPSVVRCANENTSQPYLLPARTHDIRQETI
jgi:hypothetical protein